MKKILIVSPHFYPENFKCNDIAFTLAARGYDVTVLSDIPNYPGGKFFNGYGLFKKRVELFNGIKIIRTAVIPRGKGSGSRLALNYASFALTATFWAIFLSFNRYDAVVVHETSPITVGIPAVVIKKLSKRTKLLFWVLDLWPESLQVAGGINNKSILNLFNKITIWIYQNSDKILISSRGFASSIISKGDFSDKIIYFPNWAESVISLRNHHGLPDLPDGFRVLFAGNIGEAQDFENTLAAAELLKNENIHFLILGDGRKKGWCENHIKEKHLENTVHLLGRYPIEMMSTFFASADVLYLALKDSPIFNLTCPAKLQAYMAAGKPVVAMINGEGAEIVKESRCGFSVPAGNSTALADILRKISMMPQDTLREFGENGKAYCDSHFSFEKNISLLEKLINEDATC